MKSLVVLGLPRSMSSLIHRKFGEIVEGIKVPDRAIWHDGDPWNHIHTEYPKMKKVFANSKMYQYRKHEKVMNDYKNGFLVKNVCQPKYAFEYFNKSKDFNVLVIQRPLADVVYALYARKWFWPINILGLDSDLEEHQTLENLCEAVIKIQIEYLEKIENRYLLSYNNLLFDSTLLYRKLKSMGYSCKEESHIDSVFENKRKIILNIRKTPLYEKIEGIIEKLR